jgi:hypothetical protein
VLLDIVGERVDPVFRLDHGHSRVRRRNGAAERIGELRVDSARIRQVVERCILVEAAHLHRPFDGRAVAAEREPAVWPARDRQHAAINVGRERTVDLKLRLAGMLALVEGRIVQERKAHGAFDLERAVAGKKDRGGMGIDPLDLGSVNRFVTMGGGVGE